MKYTQKKLVRWWGKGQRVLELLQIVLAQTEVTAVRQWGLGPACHSETSRRERKLDWAVERNTDFSKAVVGTLSPFKCRSWGGGTVSEGPLSPPQAGGPLGPEEGEGDAGGKPRSHMAAASHWTEDKGLALNT